VVASVSLPGVYCPRLIRLSCDTQLPTPLVRCDPLRRPAHVAVDAAVVGTVNLAQGLGRKCESDEYVGACQRCRALAACVSRNTGKRVALLQRKVPSVLAPVRGQSAAAPSTTAASGSCGRYRCSSTLDEVRLWCAELCDTRNHNARGERHLLYVAVLLHKAVEGRWPHFFNSDSLNNDAKILPSAVLALYRQPPRGS
jgi:hypothetical protein